MGDQNLSAVPITTTVLLRRFTQKVLVYVGVDNSSSQLPDLRSSATESTVCHSGTTVRYEDGDNTRVSFGEFS